MLLARRAFTRSSNRRANSVLLCLSLVAGMRRGTPMWSVKTWYCEAPPPVAPPPPEPPPEEARPRPALRLVK